MGYIDGLFLSINNRYSGDYCFTVQMIISSSIMRLISILTLAISISIVVYNLLFMALQFPSDS